MSAYNKFIYTSTYAVESYYQRWADNQNQLLKKSNQINFFACTSTSINLDV